MNHGSGDATLHFVEIVLEATDQNAAALVDRLASQRPPGCRGEVLSVSDGGLARGAFSDQAGDEFPTERRP